MSGCTGNSYVYDIVISLSLIHIGNLHTELEDLHTKFGGMVPWLLGGWGGVDAPVQMSWPDYVTNQVVHEKIGRPVSLMTIIKYRKLKIFGHVKRMHDDRLLKMVTSGMVEGRRIWMDDITDWCQMDLCAMTDMAQTEIYGRSSRLAPTAIG